MPVTLRLTELNAATAAYQHATAEALQRGLIATKPLTVTRLAELCALGEKMMQAGRRREEALMAARVSLRRENLDLVLPA